MEQRREPMDTNRIRGMRRRTSGHLIAKSISMKGAGCRSGGCAPKAVERCKKRVRELTKRTRGVSKEQMAEELACYLQGWLGYFGKCETPSVRERLEQWTRRRLRPAIWKQWREVRRDSLSCESGARASILPHKRLGALMDRGGWRNRPGGTARRFFALAGADRTRRLRDGLARPVEADGGGPDVGSG